MSEQADKTKTKQDNKYVNECRRLENEWKKTPYLEGISKEYSPWVAAVIEMQNRASGLGVGTGFTGEDSLSLVQKIFTDFALLEWVGFQPMLRLTSEIQYLTFKVTGEGIDGDIDWISLTEEQKNSVLINLVIQSETVDARTRNLKVGPYTKDSMKEASFLDKVAKDVRGSIIDEILTDLRANCATRMSAAITGDTLKEKWESLYVKLLELSWNVQAKVFRTGANWIVAGKHTARLWASGNSGDRQLDENSEEVQYLGNVNQRWRLYYDPKADPNEVLMGYKGPSYMDAGYFYNPYVLLTGTPVGGDKYGLISRYSKRLTRNGAKFYAKATFDFGE